MRIENSSKVDLIINQLDLNEHINTFKQFFSRDDSLYMEGDQELHYRYIKALDSIEFKSPPKVADFTNIKLHLKKQGVLQFEQIFEIVKVVRYFRYFKNKNLQGIIGEWMDKFVIEPKFMEVEKYFTHDGKFEENLDEVLFNLGARIREHKTNMSGSLKRLISSQKLSSYMIDTQVHFINDEECLLVRGGFNHVLKGAVIGRSSSGGFYVSPDSILKAKEQIRYINQERDAIFYTYAKEFSSKLSELLPFINFIDKEFGKFDNYQARVLFAKSKNLQLIKSKKDSKIILEGFIHPALHHAKPIHVDFSKNILMITGVNAGGKTMLLKSILSAAFMAKYIIPMKLNEHKSHVGNFKNILAIIDDPQNVKNDISTFAGRMQEFSKIFEYKEALVGVDEIELGTDSDEAAALFKVILDELIMRGQKIVVTTHHKRLAALMADRDDVELMAAIYDEQNRVPTYEFMHGIIGKSYAFETASRYGISNKIVNEAKVVYGDNSEKLNILIERGSQLERELKQKHRTVDEKLEELRLKELDLKEQRQKVYEELQKEKAVLKESYEIAINEAKQAARAGDAKAIHRAMNKANKNLPKEKPPQSLPIKFSVGESVKYHSKKGVIVAMKDEKEAIVEVDGMRVRVNTSQLKPTETIKQKPRTDVNLQVQKRAGLKCDLHGMRAEEATEVLDKFISDALINGWDEVIVYHGIGTGKLSYAVKEFLKAHPRVKKFEDAPQHMGGFGAKVVTL
ncbi:MAG: endonuclease MutS2 [Sulfurimonas sp. RIFOXYD12_FULL_33_39]|uniref:endonuclease MutS2 n=1 Tax=unclassified Sulfurimonas TaxID=2623549 RepID=UPI0008B19123|nr:MULTISPECIES: endonuclease MutS2 [unclassified Sulfurimonas]OHE08971.1 MAG: endonuclease MutS2 [Sulfurimonas sp. RIFOXYD12_FULL_33_39]OHE14281.1 MAG: endonuclease MutS2 [Sulfurimonas sp. RIFOXYD2_FULL_34_21]DAB28862.1 MAG TPA: endonuclease MutS2 [Sulfurimonas sp. UBA10385]